jgi:hypothetical protein
MREHAQGASETICGYNGSPRVLVRITTAVRKHSEARRCGGGAAAQAARQHLDPSRGTPSTGMHLQRINHWRQVIYDAHDMANPMDAKTH